jgi:hypothetical protein
MISRISRQLQVPLVDGESQQPTMERSTTTSDLMQMLIDILLGREASGTSRLPTLIRFITSQASYLDAEDTLARIPDDCNIQELESFLERALRRNVHWRLECSVEKQLASAQALVESARVLELRLKHGGQPITQQMLAAAVMAQVEAIKAAKESKHDAIN